MALLCSNCRLLRIFEESKHRIGARRAGQQAEMEQGASAEPLVLISSGKGEHRTLKAGYRQLAKHLRAAHCDVDRLTAPLTDTALEGCAILILGAPTRRFTLEELEAVKSYLLRGGAVLALGAAGAANHNGSAGGTANSLSAAASLAALPSTAAASNLNYLLEEFGIALVDDGVIASAFTSYLHPREVLVDEGLLSPDMLVYCAGRCRASTGSQALSSTDENGAPAVRFAFPHGCTVVAQEPAAAILSSGRIAHPYNMCIGAVWWGDAGTAPRGGAAGTSSARSDTSAAGSVARSTTSVASGGGLGRLAVLGSAAMFDDEWLGREANTAILDFILGCVTNGTLMDCPTASDE